jgi:Fe-S oxidoreductase
MKLLSFFKKKENFYFPECINYFKYRENFDLYKEIFRKLRIKFKVLEEYRCSGYELWEAGYDFEMRKLIRKNFEIFKENKIENIFSTEPASYKMFVQDYPNILPDWNIKVINIWKLLLEKLKKKNFESKGEIISYHDSCYLGRYCEIYETPREIINILGYTIREMDNNRENSFCCGSCGGLLRTNPEIANKLAKERLAQAKRAGVKKIIVIGFENYNILKNNSESTGIEVLELSHILADALKIKKLEAK